MAVKFGMQVDCMEGHFQNAYWISKMKDNVTVLRYRKIGSAQLLESGNLHMTMKLCT